MLYWRFMVSVLNIIPLQYCIPGTSTLGCSIVLYLLTKRNQANKCHPKGTRSSSTATQSLDYFILTSIFQWVGSKSHIVVLGCGYGSIPIDTIFIHILVGWTSIYQLFWGSLGTGVLTHPHVLGINTIWLVVQELTILKNDGVRQCLVDDIPYMKWKIKTMFETTNQYIYMSIQYICWFTSWFTH